MAWINCGLDQRWKSPRVRGILLHPTKPMAWINCGLDQRWKLPRVRGILLYPAKPMAWINCGLDQRRPCGNAVARVPLRGGVKKGLSQAAMLLHASRFAEMLNMGISQAEMLIVSLGVPS